MIGYKFTDQYRMTGVIFGESTPVQWKIGERVSVRKTRDAWEGRMLCNPSWLHFYADPYLGLFLDRADMGYTARDCRLFVVETGRTVLNRYGKWGARSLRVLEEIEPPVWSQEADWTAAVLVVRALFGTLPPNLPNSWIGCLERLIAWNREEEDPLTRGWLFNAGLNLPPTHITATWFYRALHNNPPLLTEDEAIAAARAAFEGFRPEEGGAG